MLLRHVLCQGWCMAKHVGIPPFIGTEDLLCIYKMRGRYYIRKRSNLTGERVKTDPCFRNLMKHADLLKRGSGIGSRVYASLPPEGKRHSLYRKITGEAMQWLKYAWKEEDIVDFLLKKYKAFLLSIIHVTIDQILQKQLAPPSCDWQPFANRRSIKAFVRNMCDGKRSRLIRQYERYLGLVSMSANLLLGKMGSMTFFSVVP